MRAKISTRDAQAIATAATEAEVASGAYHAPTKAVIRDVIQSRTRSLTAGDYVGYLFQFDGHRRFSPFLAVHQLMDDASYWKSVAFVWDNIEVSSPDMATWLALFGSKRPRRDRLMSKKERQAFAQLPDTLMLFRGYAKGKARRGMSWTVSEERARFFARYAVGARRAELCGHQKGRTGMVVTGTALKRDVLAYFDGRSEQEIVIHPCNIVLGRSYRVTIGP